MQNKFKNRSLKKKKSNFTIQKSKNPMKVKRKTF